MSYDYQTQRDYRERARVELAADVCDDRHGKVTGYKLGCRCARCRRAWANYQLHGAADHPTTCDRVLAYVARAGETSQASIRQALGLPKSSCSAAVTRLERAGRVRCLRRGRDRVVSCVGGDDEGAHP